MEKLKNNLAGIVSLIGVVGAIGAGFTTYGQLLTTIEVLQEQVSELSSKQYVINETVDLTDTNNKINDNYESVLDRIARIQDEVNTNKNNTEINKTKIELLDKTIEAIDLKNSNPLSR